MKRYNPSEIEPKWQQKWEDDGTYVADLDSSKPKFIGFGMFNYPSGAGIHVGHARNYTIPDVITRAKRQQGFESYQPVGWDSFGLPAENFAIKTGVPPQQSIENTVKGYYKQYRAMGWGNDWSKEITTSDPSYYKWTQWIFMKLFEEGLAYQKESSQWWCNSCNTVLANEQVIDGKCWRHDGPDDEPVIKKTLKQWFFKITDYANEILEATDALDWTESVKLMQKNWIGRSEGASVKFKLEGLGTGNNDEFLEVFTTAHDTIYGTTFMVAAPEHPLITKYGQFADNWIEIQEYIGKAARKSELDREIEKDKSGIVVEGLYGVNPINGNKIPVWVADYVLMGYGTGAIMAVPGEDRRDYDFAIKYDLPIIYTTNQQEFVEYKDIKVDRTKFTLANSEEFDGQNFEIGRESILKKLESTKKGESIIQYKMRDWLISRQRYWGAPIPIIHCDKCGAVPVPEDDLPVILPEVKDYHPTGGNTSVLANVEEWVNVECPRCHGPAKRETDTMDTYVCSSWYYLRYIDPHNDKEAWGKEKAQKWMPIDFYNGADHAVAHLLYSRFLTRFFFRLGLVNTPEPFKRMVFNGKVLASDGSFFSKSKGNGVDPLEIIASGYGADALRLYEMFAAPVELNVLWDPQGVPGSYRFLNRTWNLGQKFIESKNEPTDQAAQTRIQEVTHKTIKKVTHDIANHKFNTAIAAMMEAVNSYFKLSDEHGMQQSDVWRAAIESLLQLLAPFAPHITDELWHELGHTDTIHIDHWPKWDEKYLQTDTISVVVQVNGKLRGQIEIDKDTDQALIESKAKELESVDKALSGKSPARIVYVPGRLINFVVS